MKQKACLFETALGLCGLIWSPTQIVGLVLPEKDRATLKRRIQEKQTLLIPENQSPVWVKKTIKKVQKHLLGKTQDFSHEPIGFPESSDFQKQVYQIIRKIPAGKVLSYKEVALKMEKPGASRAIGTAMGKNPVPLLVPCHRVLASGGKPGGFTAHGGLQTKAKLLQIEGYHLKLLV